MRFSDATPKNKTVKRAEEAGLATLVTSNGAEESHLVGLRKRAKKTARGDDSEALVDTTEAIPLKSKKMDRLKKKQEKKLQRTTGRSSTKRNFLELLPTELADDILSHCQPSDIFRLYRVDRATHAYLEANESSIAQSIIRRRYVTLTRSFPLPMRLDQLSRGAQTAMRSSGWQERLRTHSRAYQQQHIAGMDAQRVCSCMTCVLGWNNLCVILDLAAFQRHLSAREPLPVVPRGSAPAWNTELLRHTACRVERAMHRPLHYALLLQIHLATIVATLTRPVTVGEKTWQPKRLYVLSDADVRAATDEFLDRPGPPSYQFPYHRDNYYTLEAYVPNRQWDRERQEWLYAPPGQLHERDLAWMVARFRPRGRGCGECARRCHMICVMHDRRELGVGSGE